MAVAASLVMTAASSIFVWQMGPQRSPVEAVVGLSGFVLLAAVLWPLSQVIRRSFAALDRTRHRLAEAEREVALATERNHLHRVIHDNALQTLEALASGWEVDIDQLRSIAGKEAVLLRQVIQLDAQPSGPFAERLAAAVAIANLRGVETHLDLSDLGDNQPWPCAREAVCMAVGEALTNVAKHAETMEAFVRVSRQGNDVEVSVEDEGRGFDPDEVDWSEGVQSSIIERISEVGGSVEVSSSPGHGTSVRILVPVC